VAQRSDALFLSAGLNSSAGAANQLLAWPGGIRSSSHKAVQGPSWSEARGREGGTLLEPMSPKASRVALRVFDIVQEPGLAQGRSPPPAIRLNGGKHRTRP